MKNTLNVLLLLVSGVFLTFLFLQGISVNEYDLNYVITHYTKSTATSVYCLNTSSTVAYPCKPEGELCVSEIETTCKNYGRYSI